MNLKTSCYCTNNIPFDDCCGKFLNLSQNASTAEELMRSRYSAFCAGNVEYLLNTQILEEEHANEGQLIQNTINNTNWIGLKIVNTINGQQHQQTGQVEFIAFFYQKDSQHPQEIQQIHENSSFKKINELWYYTQGTQLNPIKLSRNEICVCGSGKKFKKCHGA